MKVVALAGGTGSSKLLRGLQVASGRFTVIANPGDDLRVYGLYVSPDTDVAMYTLAGVANKEQGWGVEGDTFSVLDQMRRLGEETWFRLGDKDLATCLMRTQLLGAGKSLTQATSSLCKRLRVKQRIIPPTDDHVETHVVTKDGEMHFQEFWVKNRGGLEVRKVTYAGAHQARVTREAASAIKSADKILICPGNPVTSIGPILAVGEFRTLMKGSKARKVALSPMIGRGAFSGPAPKLLRAIGVEATSLGVAELYADIIDEIIIHQRDRDQAAQISRLGVECKTANTTMKSNADEIRLAKYVLKG